MKQYAETQKDTLVVGLGEMHVTRNSSAVLTCLGLGSCISVCAYDPVSKVGGMDHIVLPNSEGRNGTSSSKYADTAIPMLIDELNKEGAKKNRLIIKLVGGAEMSLAPGITSAFKIGAKNIVSVKEAIARENLKIATEDIGGHHGRTVRLFMDSGKVIVTTAGADVKEL
ncbi:MAG: chemotaxis protein CheD [Chloroflexota bacterium]|nr:chemotaxis protein CheD [Chloroflexota bacterium]